MKKIHKWFRLTAYLIVSTLLAASPVMNVYDVHAAVSVGQITTALGITDETQKSRLSASFGRAPNTTDCLQTFYESLIDKKPKLELFVSCGNEIGILLGVTGPYLKALHSISPPGLLLPSPLGPDPVLSTIYNLYTTETGKQIIEIAQTALDFRLCLSYIALVSAAAIFPATRFIVSSMSGAFAVGFIIACGSTFPVIMSFFDNLSNILLIHPVTSIEVRSKLAPPAVPACFANKNTNINKPVLACYAERAYGNPNGTPTGGTTGGTTAPVPIPPACVPGPSEVSFFVDQDFRGSNCVVKGIGTYNNPGEIGLANDSISSIRVGANVKARVCNNADMNSPCEEITKDETILSDNSINDNTISAVQVMMAGGVQLCTDINYSGTCKWFDFTSVNDLATYGLSNNISSVKVGKGYTLYMYSGTNLSGTPSAYLADVSDLKANSWDNFARSMKIEPRYDTTCNVDPNANGIVLYRDPSFATGGGCTLTTTNIRDLGGTFPKPVALKFSGNYKYNYKVTIYHNTDYTNVCGVYTLDQSDLRDCARIGLSLRIEPYISPATATNYAPLALRDSTGSSAVVDDNLGTEWIGGNKKPLGFVFDSPKQIKSVVIFDRNQSSMDNNQINKSKVVFSDGTVINNIDMTSGGPRCAQVDFPAKAVNWVNVLPDDASGNNGFREIQIWGSDGAVNHNNNCVMKFNVTPTPGTGPAPTVSWPTVAPPNAVATAPATNTTFPHTASTVGFDFNTGDTFRIHVWGADYDYTTAWSTAKHVDIANLARGTYSWQVQGKNAGGEGQWSAVRSFTINNPPVVMGSSQTMDAGTSKTIKIQAYDADLHAMTLSASSLPSFATLTNEGEGVATLVFNPSTSQAGEYVIPIAASDGYTTGAGQVVVVVNGPTASSTYQAQYYNNKTLTGTPVLTRAETTINNDWGSGSPGTGVPVDNFSARWTRTINFTAGTYRFTATGDDGIRLFIDGQLVIDKWINQGATTYTVDRTLTAGNHTIVYEYYEATGGAVAKLSYQQVTTPPPAPTGYTGQYFANKTLTGTPAVTRTDAAINFDWGSGSPASAIPVDNFSVRWTRTASFTAGTYRFTSTSDDGVRLRIDGQPVIDKWINQGSTTYTADRTLTQGDHTITYEYFENSGGAVAKFSYAAAPAAAITELLTSPWQLTGNNGAAERYQTINSNSLVGKTTMRITYNLRGLTAIGGDASAIIFDQNGWKYVSLANYGQNGLNGTQTVDIPLSAFGLNLTQSVGQLHSRFWYGSAFTVDITSIKVF